MTPEINILDEQIIEQQGSFRRVRQYIEGWYPELGMLHFGWSGNETILEKDIITPLQKTEDNI